MKMSSYPITIYVLLNPDKDLMSAYTSDFEANEELEKNNAFLGSGWNIEPVSLRTTEKFYERLKHIFENQVTEEDVIEADTGEVQPKKKKKLLKHKK